jgi:hypothetical protein
MSLMKCTIRYSCLLRSVEINIFLFIYLFIYLAYGFLSQSLRLLFGHHKHWTEVLDFWFAGEVFKIKIGRSGFCLLWKGRKVN